MTTPIGSSPNEPAGQAASGDSEAAQKTGGSPFESRRNRTFDEIALGERASLERTLSPQDIQLFAALSGDASAQAPTSGAFEPIAVHSPFSREMWAGALFAGLIGTKLPGPGSAYLGQTLKFMAPIASGDTLKLTVEVIGRDPETCEVQLACVAENHRGERVVEGEARVIAPARRIDSPRSRLPELVSEQNGLLTLMRHARDLGPIRVAVVHPCDALSLAGALDARDAGLIEPILVAPRARLEAVAREAGLDLDGIPIEDVAHSHAAADRAAQLAATGEVEALMKGSLHSDELIAAVIDASAGLRTKRRVSHCFLMHTPAYPRPFIITDAAINIAPGLNEKADIVRNAIELAQVIGVRQPKVAILAAVETVNPAMPATLDAAALCKMADRGQITGCLLDGPLAFDNAVSIAAAQIKGIHSPVAGQADVLVVPDLESGNMLAKQLEHMGNAASAGIVLGAKIPIVLTSRADPRDSRIASCAIAVLLAHRYRTSPP